MAIDSISRKKPFDLGLLKGPSGPDAASRAPNGVEKAAAPLEAPRGYLARDGFKTGAAAPSFQLPLPGPSAVPVGRSKQEALQGAELLLRGGTLAEAQSNGATVTRDAPDVNAAEDVDSRSARHQATRAELEKNRALEKQVLAGMLPREQSRYEAVQRQLQAAGDPVAELALQKLLFDGRLPGAKDVKGEGSLLAHLAKLADPTNPLAEGLDRGALLSDVVQELAVPASIAQQSKNTCGPTTASIHLAMNNPAEYVRLVTGLASPGGQVRLANGDLLARAKGTVADDGSGRSHAQRLMEPALMDYANGPLAYDNARDKHLLFGRIPTLPGALPMMMDRMLQGLYGREFRHRDLVMNLGGSKPAAMERIRQETASGQQVPVMMSFDDNPLTSLHWVLATGTKTVEGQEHVSYLNPWGREESMPRAEFERRMRGLSWDER